jgi:hypothetical protein
MCGEIERKEIDTISNKPPIFSTSASGNTVSHIPMCVFEIDTTLEGTKLGVSYNWLLSNFIRKK